MKNKINKGKRIGIAVMGLSATALVGVGFSTWVVMMQDTKDTGNINVEVADVQDQTLKIVLEGNQGVVDGKIRFDAKESDKTGNIQYAGAPGQGEDLEFQIQFSIDIPNTEYFYGVSVSPKNSAELQSWVTNNWITSPFALDGTDNPLVDATWTEDGDHYLAGGKSVISSAAWTTKVNVKKDTATTKRTFTITSKLGWGTAFNGKNPSENDSDPVTVQSSVQALQAFKAAANSKHFTLTLKHDPQAASGKITIPAQ